MAKQKPDFKRDLAELEQIVEWFESSEVDVEAALAKFERGQELTQALTQQLTTLQNKVEEVRTPPKEAA